MNKNFKILIWPVLILVLAFLFKYYSNSQTDLNEHVHHDHKLKNQENKKELTKKLSARKKADSKEFKEAKKFKEEIKIRMKSFSYQREVERVKELSGKYPETRQQIIDYVSKADPYKEANIEVEPHSLDSIKQNQIGALKVLALKSIESREGDTSKKVQFYRDLLQKAQDPTIKKILSAAIDSASMGRDFLKDFPEAIHNAPLESDLENESKDN